MRDDDRMTLSNLALAKSEGNSVIASSWVSRRSLGSGSDSDIAQALASERAFELYMGSIVPNGRPGWHRPLVVESTNYTAVPYAQCAWPGYGCAAFNRCGRINASTGLVDFVEIDVDSAAIDGDGYSTTWMCRACPAGSGYWWGSCYECAWNQPPLLNALAFVLLVLLFAVVLFLFRASVYGVKSACAIAEKEETLKRTASLGKATLQKWKAAGNAENALLRATSRKHAGRPGAAAELFGDQAKALASKGKKAVLDQINALQESAFAGKIRNLGASALRVAGEAGAWIRQAAACIQGLCGKDKDPYVPVPDVCYVAL